MRYLFGEFELDPLLFQLRRGAEVIKIEPKIFDVLAYLIRHHERVVPKSELLDAIWPGEFVSESVLPRCIATARKALGDTRARAATIATVHGRGYRFIAPLETEDRTEGRGQDRTEARGLRTESPPPSPMLREGRSSLSPQSSSLGPDPLIGREDALARMRAALEDALAGRGRVSLVVGEPGIGKTRLVEEIAGEARRRGALVVSGRCHESEGAPAYWPWVQVLRGCLRGRGAGSVERDMGLAAADIALLVPEVAARSAATPPAAERGGAGTAADEARFRLFDSVTTLLRNAAEEEPLVLLLDDLHWADNPSLLLFQYLAREIRESRLLVAATYRDVELRRHHPLVRVLGELAREPHCQRLHLHGLGRSDVGKLIEVRLGRPASPALAAAVHEMTEGNPFFVGEIAGLLATSVPAAGAAVPLGLAAGERDWTILLPQSVREAIGRRLDRLSPACNRVLGVASVIGRDFDLSLLERVLPVLPPDESAAVSGAAILDHLDEAVAARILAAESAALGRYSFSHALIRQTLYEELPIPLRLRLHQKVAEVVEDLHAMDPDPYLSQIAHHLYQGAAAGTVEKAVDAALRAARHAQLQLAYEEAADHYERALQLLEYGHAAAERPPEERFEILHAAAEAESISGIRDRSQENCRRAAAIARNLGRADLLARAALLFGQRAEAGPLPAQELRALLEEALAALGEEHPGLRSRVLSRLSATAPYQNSMETRAAMSRDAVDLARRAEDQNALFDALAAQLWALLGPDQDDERLRAADDLARLIEQTGDRERLLIVQEHRARSFLAWGDLASADRETDVYEALAAELRQPSFLLFAKWYRIARALGDGRFADAEALMQESFALGKRLQHPATTGMLLWHLFWSRRQRGDLSRFEDATQEAFRTYGDVLGIDVSEMTSLDSGVDAVVRQYSFDGAFVPSVVIYIYHEAGREADTRAAFEKLAGRDFVDIPRDEWWMPTLSLLAEVAAALADTRRCRALYDLLEPAAQLNAAHTLLRTYAGSTAHFLGLLAVVLGRPEDVTRHFETALERNAAWGARPALVRTQAAYGRWLAARGRRAEAQRGLDLLRQAAAGAEEIGLDAVAERIRKEIIRTP